MSETYQNGQFTDLNFVRQWLGTGSLNLFGLPFAGKDTQAYRLSNLLKAPAPISGGDILRKRLDLPSHVREIMDRGELIPIDEYLATVTPYLGQAGFVGHPLVLSSVGRYKGEEEGVMKALKSAGHPLRAVIWIEVDEEVIRQRQAESDHETRGTRADDDLETLETRLLEYEAKTKPVLDFYAERSLLLAIDGNGSLDEVTRRILTSLHDFAVETYR